MVEEMGRGNKLEREKKGPWSLGERRVKVTTWRRGVGGGGVEGKPQILPRRRGHNASFPLVGILGEFQGRTLKYSSALQVCPYRAVGSTDGLAPGQGDIS